MAKKNVTIVLDEEIIRRVRDLPQVREASLSTYVASLIEREVASERGSEAAAEFLALCDDMSKMPQRSWKWNRDEIYEERLSKFDD